MRDVRPRRSQFPARHRLSLGRNRSGDRKCRSTRGLPPASEAGFRPDPAGQGANACPYDARKWYAADRAFCPRSASCLDQETASLQVIYQIRSLPRETAIGFRIATEMTIGCGPRINRAAELKSSRMPFGERSTTSWMAVASLSSSTLACRRYRHRPKVAWRHRWHRPAESRIFLQDRPPQHFLPPSGRRQPTGLP